MYNNKVNIINYWYGLYGGIITAFALQELVKECGYDCSLINNMREKEYLTQEKSFNKKFADKHFNITPRITNSYPLEKINENANIFITGSDQVFRTQYISSLISQYLLTFTSPNKKRIAFSASFGVGKEQFLKETTPKDMKIMQEAMRAFDYISVREKSGVDICKDVFNVEAEWVIDPVFILNKQKYEDLAAKSKKDYTNKIVSYILRPQKEYEKAYKYLTEKYNAKVEQTAYTNVLLEDWLNAIKSCKFLLTDSFHGVCFAIIFNKPFICIAQNVHGKARLDSIFEMLGIENQSISSIDEIYRKDCIFKINYESVNQRIKEVADKGRKALENVLNSPVIEKQEKINSRMVYLENKVNELNNQCKLSYQVKRYFWNKWLRIYHCYLPKCVKSMLHQIKKFL